MCMTKLRILVLCFSYFTDNSNVQEIFFLSRTGHGVPFSSLLNQKRWNHFLTFFQRTRAKGSFFIIIKVKNCLTVVQTWNPRFDPRASSEFVHMIRTRYIPKRVRHAELAYNRRMHCNLGPLWRCRYTFSWPNLVGTENCKGLLQLVKRNSLQNFSTWA